MNHKEKCQNAIQAYLEAVKTDEEAVKAQQNTSRSREVAAREVVRVLKSVFGENQKVIYCGQIFGIKKVDGDVPPDSPRFRLIVEPLKAVIL